MRRLLAAFAVLALCVPAVAVALAPDISPRPTPRIGGVVPMTVQSSAQDARFRSWATGFRQRAVAQGIAPQVFDAAFRTARYLPDVVRKDRNQSEFTKQIWDYLDSAVSQKRVRNGRKALRDHGSVLAQIEARYGVEAEVVAAVWGMESAYGEIRGDVPVISALATLAFDGRRGRFFEEQLIAALRIVQAGDIRPEQMLGSWAGAMGHTQFIPTSYIAYAQDFRGDGRRDIWSDDPTDALASTAAYLRRFGWRKGQPWGVEVRMPQGFDYGLAGDHTKKSVGEWMALGVRDANGRPVPDYGRASILLPAGASGAAFMIFDNFHVISRYNAADAYVIGVGHLSDRIAGGGPIKAKWPTGDRGLKFAERQEMQQRLTRAGFDTNGVDGVIGPNTVRAIRSFQRSQGLTPDGHPSYDILRRLR